jgi:hypothetical protein
VLVSNNWTWRCEDSFPPTKRAMDTIPPSMIALVLFASAQDKAGVLQVGAAGRALPASSTWQECPPRQRTVWPLCRCYQMVEGQTRPRTTYRLV